MVGFNWYWGFGNGFGVGFNWYWVFDNGFGVGEVGVVDWLVGGG